MTNETLTAYHEAGHAVVAYRFNHVGGRLTIVPKDGILGSSTSEGAWGDGSTDDEQIVVLFAGREARRWADPTSRSPGSSQDDEQAAHLLRFSSRSAVDLREETRRIIESDWSVITAVATGLLESKTLVWDEWTIIVDAVDEGEDWRAVLEQFRRLWGDRFQKEERE